MTNPIVARLRYLIAAEDSRIWIQDSWGHRDIKPGQTESTHFWGSLKCLFLVGAVLGITWVVSTLG